MSSVNNGGGSGSRIPEGWEQVGSTTETQRNLSGNHETTEKMAMFKPGPGASETGFLVSHTSHVIKKPNFFSELFRAITEFFTKLFAPTPPAWSKLEIGDKIFIDQTGDPIQDVVNIDNAIAKLGLNSLEGANLGDHRRYWYSPGSSPAYFRHYFDKENKCYIIERCEMDYKTWLESTRTP